MSNTLIRRQPFAFLGELRSRFARILLCPRRARPKGKGNGRVYRIAYEVSDGKGGNCSGTVAVGVPKNMGRGSTPVDSAPPSFNSFAR